MSEEYKVEPVTQTAVDIIASWLLKYNDEEAQRDARAVINELEQAGYVIALMQPQGN